MKPRALKEFASDQFSCWLKNLLLCKTLQQARLENVGNNNAAQWLRKAGAARRPLRPQRYIKNR